MGGLCAPRTFAAGVATICPRRKFWLGALVILSLRYTCLQATLGDLEQVSWSFLAPIIFIAYLFHSLAIGFRRLILGHFFFVTFRCITNLITVNSSAVQVLGIEKDIFLFSSVFF